MKTTFLYKYQPKTLDEFHLEGDFIELIKVHIEMDNLNLLLVGNSGCGKTSLIQSIVRSYYGDAYNAENIMIINSIHDKGITYYRTHVKTFCQTCSLVRGKKKIIILDDLEHVNEQSQQVFRSCLEKNSSNVHFIASCSDTQHVIDNLKSSLSMMKMYPVTNQVMREIGDRICEREDIRLSDAAAQFLVRISNHSIRTLLNYLEKSKLLSFDYEEIDLDMAQAMCTNISFSDMEQFTKEARAGRLNDSVAILYRLFDHGYSVIDILDSYFIYVKITESLTEDEKYLVIKLLTKYVTMFYTVHEDEIELAFFSNRLTALLKT